MTNSELKESEYTFPFDSAYDFFAYDPVKTRLLEMQAEAEGQTNFNASFHTLCVLSFCLQLVFTSRIGTMLMTCDFH